MNVTQCYSKPNSFNVTRNINYQLDVSLSQIKSRGEPTHVDGDEGRRLGIIPREREVVRENLSVPALITRALIKRAGQKDAPELTAAADRSRPRKVTRTIAEFAAVKSGENGVGESRAN